MTHLFNEDYFLRGPESGLSNYVNYSWMEERTMAFAKTLIDTLGIKRDDSLVDIGCARGYAVKALRRLGVNAVGYDISEWAIKNCDPEVEKYVSTAMPPQADYVLCKDVMEHLELKTMGGYIDWILSTCEKAALIIVPLAKDVPRKYIREEDEKDSTHIHRWTLMEWLDEFLASKHGPEWSMSASYHINGLKPTSFSHPRSCGFITLRRQPQ